jgi:hypothetical protein
MPFEVNPTEQADGVVEELATADPRRYSKVIRALAKLAQDPKHPGLRSHPYNQIKGPLGEPIWESYVENHNPSAWRLWWYYGPARGEITVVDIGPHS